MRKFLGLLLALCCIPAFGDTLVLNDGTTHQGTLVSATSRWITFQENNTSRRYLRSSVQSIQFGNNGAMAANGPYNNNYPNPTYGNNYPNNTTYGNNAGWGNRNSSVNLPQNATLPSGTDVSVITNENIDSSTANEGQTFSADVAENVTDSNGNVIIPKGSQAQLVIRQVQEGGTTSAPEIALGLNSVMINGRRYLVNTQDVTQSGNSGIGKNKRTAEMIGGGAVLGTLIGAIAGGGKGAAIGAVTGGAAGAGVQVLTRGKTVKVPAETTLSFQLDQPLNLQQAR